MADPTNIKELPGIEERYQTAGNAKNLKVSRLEDNRIGDAEVLIAAGWSPVHMGLALMRLQSEWDAIEHPRRMNEEQVRALASTHLAAAQAKPGDQPLDGKGAMRLAIADAGAWYANELALMRQKLKSMPLAVELLRVWCVHHNMDPHIALRGLRWWLDHICRACNGRRFETVPNQPALSHKRCMTCRGSGEIFMPDGRMGGRIQSLLNDCRDRARASIRSRLHKMGK